MLGVAIVGAAHWPAVSAPFSVATFRWGKTAGSSGSRADFVSLALRTFQHAVGLLVADDLLGRRVPLQRAAQADREVGQVARADRPMVRKHIRDRQLPGLHALDEVA